MFSSATSETLHRHVNFSKAENWTHIWYAVWLQLWVYLIICGNTLTNSLLPVLYTLSLWLGLVICVSPLLYIAMDCIMRYLFSLHVFKQIDAQIPVLLNCAPTHPHSFILWNTHSRENFPRFLTIKYSSILEVMGLYTMSVSRKNVFAVRCLQMHWLG